MRRTPNLQLPYPEPDDLLTAYPAVARELAEKVDTAASTGLPPEAWPLEQRIAALEGKWAFVQSSTTDQMPGWDPYAGGIMSWTALDNLDSAPFAFAPTGASVPDGAGGNVPPNSFFFRYPRTDRFRFTLTGQLYAEPKADTVTIDLMPPTILSRPNAFEPASYWPAQPWEYSWGYSFSGLILPPTDPEAVQCFRVAFSPVSNTQVTDFRASQTTLLIERV